MMVKAFTYNAPVKERYVYRIKFEETGEYVKNGNNEPCECGTKGWAEILFSSCSSKYPNKKLVLVKERYIVERQQS